ncbi:MAG: YihA family ribosome biogenesis GTP-binding protein [Candidatus Pacebacteria bacterium]|nr:YihA family ribosome biogenesis GTP-binding protein [Candidatus Paceibacterota bacterium]
MNIASAEFVKGVTGDDYMISDGYPQIAFLGRSNVGKSSVINSLLGRKSLVRSSSTPGKTREANFYRINNKFYFVDFPGYGYAKMSKKDRDRIAKRILWYIQYSTVKPESVMLVIDMQVGITDLDEEMLRILHSHGHEVNIIANKVDKLKQQEITKQLKKIHAKAGGVNIFMYSAKTKKGKNQVLEEIFKRVGLLRQ